MSEATILTKEEIRQRFMAGVGKPFKMIHAKIHQTIDEAHPYFDSLVKQEIVSKVLTETWDGLLNRSYLWFVKNGKIEKLNCITVDLICESQESFTPSLAIPIAKELFIVIDTFEVVSVRFEDTVNETVICLANQFQEIRRLHNGTAKIINFPANTTRH
jgi:hypothetical protein